ncbi:MAG: hypothetical protein WA220_05575 [Candidatus Nitrosopolaris sp.]|jgi:hypothetical protein
MEIEWNEEDELPVVRCPVCKKNGLKNDERYPPYELFMHLKSRAHKTRGLADTLRLIQVQEFICLNPKF